MATIYNKDTCIIYTVICFSNDWLQAWVPLISSLQGLLLSLDTHLTYVPECVRLINHKNGDIPWGNWTLYKKHLLRFLKKETGSLPVTQTAAPLGGLVLRL